MEAGGGVVMRELVLAYSRKMPRSPCVAHKATNPFDMFFTK